MNSINKVITSGILVALIAVSFPSRSEGQIQTEVIIDFPGIALVNYFSEITVDLDASTIAAAFFSGVSGVSDEREGISASDSGSASITASFGSGEFTGDAAISAGALSLDSFDLVLENVWAVRSTRPGTIAVSVPGGSVSLSGDNGGTIDVFGATVTPDSFDRTGFSSANAVIGDVILELDLESATSDGTYSAGAPVYQLDVELN